VLLAALKAPAITTGIALLVLVLVLLVLLQLLLLLVLQLVQCTHDMSNKTRLMFPKVPFACSARLRWFDCHPELLSVTACHPSWSLIALSTVQYCTLMWGSTYFRSTSAALPQASTATTKTQNVGCN
jgi:hypothetical protein